MNGQTSIPVVLTFSGSDATGGAGVQADIEALASHGCHAAAVLTAVTVQDTADVRSYMPLAADIIAAQARAVLADLPVRACKIGLLGSTAAVQAVHSVLIDYPDLAVVLDPVLVAGGGTTLAGPDVIDAINALLLPLTTVLTPNIAEARALAKRSTTEECALALLEGGCEFVLVTGADADTPHVVNALYGEQRLIETFTWDRLPGSFHGSGCTLAASIAGLLAQGLEPFYAVHEAQEYTWQTLQHAYRLGKGQALPNRLFWARDDAKPD